MQVLSFVSLKGGVGKTSSAITTARILAEQGNRVLLVDLDPQNAASSHFFDEVPLGKTIHQVLLNQIEMEESIQKVSHNLDFIPSEIELSLIESELAGITNQSFILLEALETIADNYDYCVIDTPPALGLLTKSAVIASDRVIIPTQLEKWAIRAIEATKRGLSDCKKAAKYTGKNFTTIILPTFFEGNRKIKEILLNSLRETFMEVSETVIHLSTEVGKTYAQTAVFLNPSTRAHREYWAFLSELGILKREAEHVG